MERFTSWKNSFEESKEILGTNMKTTKGYTENPIQLVYPRELHCNRSISEEITNSSTSEEVKLNGKNKLNANTVEFKPRQITKTIASLEFKNVRSDVTENEPGEK